MLSVFDLIHLLSDLIHWIELWSICFHSFLVTFILLHAIRFTVLYGFYKAIVFLFYNYYLSGVINSNNVKPATTNLINLNNTFQIELFKSTVEHYLYFLCFISTVYIKENQNIAMSVFFLIFWSPTVNPLNNSPDQWVNACMCKGYSHFSEEHVAGVIGGGKSLQVSLQLKQLPLHLPEALFQILCRHWNTSTYIKTHEHTHTVHL